MAGLLDGGEVGCPEDAVAPVIDLAGGFEAGGEDGLIRAGVDEGELFGVVAVGAFNDGLLGRGGFVAYLVYEDFDLRLRGNGRRSCAGEKDEVFRQTLDGGFLLVIQGDFVIRPVGLDSTGIMWCGPLWLPT